MATNPPTTPDALDDSPVAGLLDRLDRARGGLVRTVIVIIGTCIACFVLGDQFFEYMIQPLCTAFASLDPPKQCGLYPVDLLEPFIVYLKLGILVGIFLSSPFWFYQLWGLVAPVLMKKERRLVYVFTFFAATLFVGGASFGYFIVFPLSFRFLLEFTGANIEPMISMSSYFKVISMLLVGFGIAFELPLVMILLARLGIVRWDQYAKYRKYAVIAILVTSAILTPQDPGSMLMMAAPLTLLYEIGILVSRVVGRKPPWALDADDSSTE